MNKNNEDKPYSIYPPSKWYNRERFPLIPVIKRRKRDEHNASSFSFKWLFFTLWTLSHPCIEISIVLSSHWGIGIIGVLPYLRWAVCIPIPLSVGLAVDRFLSRDPRLK
jgi:hypothetical protein